MGRPGQKRPEHPPHELAWLWAGLAGKSCPVCLEALDNGTALIIEPGGLMRHVKCERVPLYGSKHER
jgi:hypothetical protein